LKVRKLLEANGYVQGRDFFHNIMFEKDKRHRYWVDFIIPAERLIIEVDPSIWHRMWSRDKSDNQKFQFLESLGYRVVSVNEKTYKTIADYLKWTISVVKR
jgi:very-short-patch-repair endonuclease